MLFVIESVVGIEKPIYYWEKDSCIASVCVKMREKNVPVGDDGYVHVLNFTVTSGYGVCLKQILFDYPVYEYEKNYCNSINIITAQVTQLQMEKWFFLLPFAITVLTLTLMSHIVNKEI